MRQPHCDVTPVTVSRFLETNYVLVCKLRNSRVKAKQIAIAEMFCALYQFGIQFIVNGPLGDIKGLISFFVQKNVINDISALLASIGYSDRFYLLDFENDFTNNSDLISINPLEWKKKPFGIRLLYRQDRTLYEKQSPHNKTFQILSADGTVKEVTGYRGNGTDLGRRALPVEDSRCLINLAVPSLTKKILEPFSGAGGIVHIAKNTNPLCAVTSVDIDPVLRPGLAFLGAEHYTGDASTISFDKQFDAIITETPFDARSTRTVADSIINTARYLCENGRISLMCASHQRALIVEAIESLKMYIYVLNPLNRKGTDVVILCAAKSEAFYRSVSALTERLKTIF
jgi:hypothetical protein